MGPDGIPRVRSSIANQQDGFMQCRSTVTHMLPYSDHIYTLLDNNVLVVAVCFDVKKMSDSVKHNFSMAKLEKYGFDIDFLTPMHSFCSTGDNVLNSIAISLRRLR